MKGLVGDDKIEREIGRIEEQNKQVHDHELTLFSELEVKQRFRNRFFITRGVHSPMLNERLNPPFKPCPLWVYNHYFNKKFLT